MRRKGKDIARWVFYRGARCLQLMPGWERGTRLFQSAAPEQAEWLERRYRAYARRAAEQSAVRPSMTGKRSGMSMLGQTNPRDTSAEEARLYRQLAARSLSAGDDAARG